MEAAAYSARREETRKRIIDAFWRLHANQPVSQLKVQSIASAAGCSRTTFYQYFDSIYDLEDQAEEEFVEDAAAFVEARVGALRDHGSYALAELTTETIESFGDRLRALSLYSDGPSITMRLADAARPALASMLELDAEDPTDAFVADTLIGYTMAAVTSWYKHDQPIPIRELSEGVNAMFTEWILPRVRSRGQPVEE